MTKILIDRAVVEQVLNYWEQAAWSGGDAVMVDKMNALRAALAEPVEEPVKFWPLAPLTGYYDVGGKRVWLEKDEPFPAPPQRKPLTDEEIFKIFADVLQFGTFFDVARAIERAHGIGEAK